MPITNIFSKVAKSPEIEMNLNILFMSMVVTILTALAIINFKTAITNHQAQSYLWGTLLFIFALMQFMGLKNLIIAKRGMLKTKKTMKKMGVSLEEEITPEKIEKLLQENEKKK